MERRVSTFTKAFGQRVTIEEATSWLQEIIVGVASITFLNADDIIAKMQTAD
jgi:hypothetical protein